MRRAAAARPASTWRAVVIRLAAGRGNYLASNHMVALDVHTEASDSCFSAQVDAPPATEASDELAVTTVLVDPSSTRNTILDSGGEAQVVAAWRANAVRATPTVGA